MKRSKHSILIAACCFAAAIILLTLLQYTGHGAAAGSAWSLFPPLLAIALALITKEAYSSLLVGVIVGAYMVSGCSAAVTVDTVVTTGLTNAISGNAGIFLFLVLLGMVVALINKTGASRSFGEWAQKHIKSRRGAQLATFVLGILIFIDDYFNCLTVGSVMSPVTDSKRVSRVKLAYIIDATAAPICMIAPVSSWAAAVSGCVTSETYSGVSLFIRSIPFNFYSLYTLVFVLTMIILGIDYGKMSAFEIKAQNDGDLSITDLTLKEEWKQEEKEPSKPNRGRIADLIVPVCLLIAFCVWGLLRNGYQSIDGTGSVIDALSATDASVGLPWGGLAAVILICVFLYIRKVISFAEIMECLPDGFIAMVPAITILTLATSLKIVTNLLDASTFAAAVISDLQHLSWLLPAFVFLFAAAIAFATGSSWGTFGILIPIVSAIFPETSSLYFIGISSCLAGAVCGDHCSPISDTTIMSSAGAHCDHLSHVETQLPYAMSVAAISFITYLAAGALSLVDLAWLAIPLGAAVTVLFPVIVKALARR